MRSILVGIKGVCAAVNDNQINHKLDNLHGRQVTLPPDLGTRGGTEVIIVHENVHSKVERDRHPGLSLQLSALNESIFFPNHPILTTVVLPTN